MQFTKTLAATAALLTVAGAAAAADVTLYGIVDEGLLYKHTRQWPEGRLQARVRLQFRHGRSGQ